MKQTLVKAFALIPLIVLIFYFPVACGGGGGGSDGGGTAAAGTTNGLSSSQQAFRTARGFPDMFTLGFVTHTLDGNGFPVPLATIRRVESWIYNRTNLTSALFDNGFFISETNWGPGDPSLRPTSLNPAQFLPQMTREDIVALLGEPTCAVDHTTAGTTLHIMRYAPTTTQPITSVVLADGQLNSVVAGFAVLPEGVTLANLCS